VGRKQLVEGSAWGTQLVRERGDELGLADVGPGDVEAGAPGHVGVHGHERAAVGFQERVGVGQQAKYLARAGPHGGPVAAQVERVFYRSPHVAGVGEQIGVAPFADSDAGCQGCAVLSGPGIERS